MNKRILLALIFTLLFSSTFFGHYLSRQNPKESTLQVIPGSQGGNYNLTFKSDVRGPVTLMIFDITGKYVYLKTFKDFNGELRENIDLTQNPKGIYVFEIEGGTARDTKKVIYQ